jgi:hypothetical protein
VLTSLDAEAARFLVDQRDIAGMGVDTLTVGAWRLKWPASVVTMSRVIDSLSNPGLDVPQAGPQGRKEDTASGVGKPLGDRTAGNVPRRHRRSRQDATRAILDDSCNLSVVELSCGWSDLKDTGQHAQDCEA